MNKLYNLNGILHAKVKLDLLHPVTIHGTEYKRSNDVQYIPVDDVISLLVSNYNLKVEIGGVLVKKPLYQFECMVKNKEYLVVDITQHKKEEPEFVEEQETKVEVENNKPENDKQEQSQQFKKKDRKKFHNDQNQKDGE